MSMTKTDIIKAAFRVWGRELYRKTSLTHIARELGVTKPALYRHFKNKQDLLNEMYNYFFDEFAAAIKADYDKALQTENLEECYLIMARSFTRYYCFNGDAFLFSLIQVYDHRQMNTMGDELIRRGMDMRPLVKIEKNQAYPNLIQLIMATITFWVAHFYKGLIHSGEESLSNEALVEQEIALMERKLRAGLGLDAETVAALDFEDLEKRLAGSLPEDSENDRLLRAVAGAVAEAGPWKASMDMVARRSGLSKSGLYAHFESREEMLAQLFLTETDRIIAYAEASRKKSSLAEEQLYLVIIAVADYLRSRPEFLIAIDWLRLRKPNMGSHRHPSLRRIFADIKLEAFQEESSDQEAQLERVTQWIFFLIINVLMRRRAKTLYRAPSAENIAAVPNESFRQLYKFITLGMKGHN
jgi:AcrR family transcriptional regulator